MSDLSVVDDIEELYFGSMAARWYQIAQRNQVEDAFIHHNAQRVCLVSPTGTGKTVSAGIIFNSEKIRSFVGVSNELDAQGRYKEKLRVLFVAHRDRLLQQAVVTYAMANGVELIIQSCFSDIPVGVLEKGWHLTVLDEAHHEAMAQLQYQLENYTQSVKNKLGFIPLLGLTATPDRADGCIIKFDILVNVMSREQAVTEGWLAKTYVYSFVDANSRDNKVDLLTDIFEEYHEQMGRGIVFVATKAEARELSDNIGLLTGKLVFNAVDVSSGVLNQALDDFSKGKWDFIVNCGKLGEGVDVKGCESVIIGENVNSYPKLNQYIGRASRCDCDCRVWELVNPLKINLDTTVVVGIPEQHKLIYKKKGQWVEQMFDYTSEELDDSFAPLIVH